MVLIIIVTLIFLVMCWFLFSPLELQIDTRFPQATLRWFSIGKAIIMYENKKWWLKIRVLFFYKQWELEKLVFAKKKRKRIPKKRKPGKNKVPARFFALLKTFRITRWQVAIDTGDATKNAWLYPLNFFPYTWQHLYINFTGENYLVITIRNAPWKLAYTFLK
jgi:hypothetical protein